MTNFSQDNVHARQIAFFSAFLLPVFKLLETPSLLAKHAGGDLLLPALLHCVLQAGLLFLLLFSLSRTDKTMAELLKERLGKWRVAVYIAYAVFFLLYAILPILDLEKFVYAVFYDTSPTLFSFTAFFILLGFACTKGLKAVGRVADLALFLFVLPFVLLLIMSLAEADASNLLPFFEQDFSGIAHAFKSTAPHFADVAMLLPLFLNFRYKKGDGKKIMLGYGVGAVFVLVFLGVFYGVYSTIAPREHYAFAKIAQYFPALTIVGRIDLLLVYALCILLFFATAIPLVYAVDLTAQTIRTEKKTLLSAVVAIGAFVFVLFNNKYYNEFYAVVSGKLYPVFWVFGLFLPVLVFCLRGKNRA
jgi:hypothetical protein